MLLEFCTQCKKVEILSLETLRLFKANAQPTLKQCVDIGIYGYNGYTKCMIKSWKCYYEKHGKNRENPLYFAWS